MLCELGRKELHGRCLRKKCGGRKCLRWDTFGVALKTAERKGHSGQSLQPAQMNGAWRPGTEEQEWRVWGAVCERSHREARAWYHVQAIEAEQGPPLQGFPQWVGMTTSAF